MDEGREEYDGSKCALENIVERHGNFCDIAYAPHRKTRFCRLKKWNQWKKNRVLPYAPLEIFSKIQEFAGFTARFHWQIRSKTPFFANRLLLGEFERAKMHFICFPYAPLESFLEIQLFHGIYAAVSSANSE